jgi:hypothetical protein
MLSCRHVAVGTNEDAGMRKSLPVQQRMLKLKFCRQMGLGEKSEPKLAELCLVGNGVILFFVPTGHPTLNSSH